MAKRRSGCIISIIIISIIMIISISLILIIISIMITMIISVSIIISIIQKTCGGPVLLLRPCVGLTALPTGSASCFTVTSRRARTQGRGDGRRLPKNRTGVSKYRPGLLRSTGFFY